MNNLSCNLSILSSPSIFFFSHPFWFSVLYFPLLQFPFLRNYSNNKIPSLYFCYFIKVIVWVYITGALVSWVRMLKWFKSPIPHSIKIWMPFVDDWKKMLLEVLSQLSALSTWKQLAETVKSALGASSGSSSLRWLKPSSVQMVRFASINLDHWVFQGRR